MGFFEIFAGALAGFYSIVPIYGVAIILLTLAVRIVLLPLSIKQTRSQREMQRIMPEVKAIQKKYKGDRQKINEGTMALYKEHGVNPLGGCMPLLAQFPVLIALFYVVREPLKYMGYMKEGARYVVNTEASGWIQGLRDSNLAQELRENALAVNQFLGLRLDCSSSAALGGQDPSQVGAVCGNGIIDALPYFVLVVLMGVTTYFMQKQLSGSRGAISDQQAQQMQLFTRIMPVMLMFFAYSFPSGVVIYWLTTNVWTIVQQKLVLRVVPHETPGDASGDGDKAKAAKATAGKGPAGKPGKAAPAKGGGENGQRSPTRASKPHPSSKKKKKR